MGVILLSDRIVSQTMEAVEAWTRLTACDIRHPGDAQRKCGRAYATSCCRKPPYQSHNMR